VTNPADQLAWHQGRRGRGVPTLTTLVGPPGLGVRTWRAWAGSRPVAVTTSADDVARVWLTACGDLGPAAADWVRQQPWGATANLDGATAYDLSELRRASGRTDSTAAVAFATLAGQPLPDFPAVLAGVVGLDPAAARPALVALPDRAGALDAVRLLGQLAATVPSVPVAVCLTADTFAAVIADPGVAAALAREGEIRVPSVTPAEVADKVRQAGADPVPLAAAIRRVVAAGLSPEGADLFAGAVTAPAPAAPDEPYYRSKQEEFLHELLESMAETTGLFRSNRPLPFQHGNKAGEADLLAESLKIAIEVDGAYYHLTEAQYRRDRAKDRLYTHHGYDVLRFLAEDVVPRSDEVLAAILDAVAARRP
jgi:very-short-patch-repair endonuclease